MFSTCFANADYVLDLLVLLTISYSPPHFRPITLGILFTKRRSATSRLGPVHMHRFFGERRNVLVGFVDGKFVLVLQQAQLDSELRPKRYINSQKQDTLMSKSEAKSLSNQLMFEFHCFPSQRVFLFCDFFRECLLKFHSFRLICCNFLSFYSHRLCDKTVFSSVESVTFYNAKKFLSEYNTFYFVRVI